MIKNVTMEKETKLKVEIRQEAEPPVKVPLAKLFTSRSLCLWISSPTNMPRSTRKKKFLLARTSLDPPLA